MHDADGVFVIRGFSHARKKASQTDPMLRAFDTIIIDKAIERSLSIDFLLGHLRQILPRRPDLRIIVTSTTIAADRFANHFASKEGPAPVIQVSGRLFPVEQRWRPFDVCIGFF